MSYRFNCIICDAKNDGNHHCLPATINLFEANRKNTVDRTKSEPNYGTRLYDGFFHIQDNFEDSI